MSPPVTQRSVAVLVVTILPSEVLRVGRGDAGAWSDNIIAFGGYETRRFLSADFVESPP